MSRKRRKTMTEHEKFHARLFRETGMSIRAAADYFDVSVATLCRGLADMRAKFGPEQFKDRRQSARARSRTRASQLHVGENAHQ
jgi:transposase